MITIVFGETGKGKTALLAHFATETMYGKIAQERISLCKSKVKYLNKQGYNLTPPKKHITFSNFPITERVKGKKRTAYDFDVSAVGLPNEEFDTVFFPPYSSIFISEAQMYFPMGEMHSLPEYVRRFFQVHRHNHLDIYLDSQRAEVNKDIRLLATRFLCVRGMRNKYKDGNIVASYWTCIEFEKYQDVDAFSRGGTEAGVKNGVGRKIEIKHNGNIFKTYNSYSFEGLFYENMHNRDFDIPPQEKRRFSDE